MIERVKSAIFAVDYSSYLSDPRDDYRHWRESERPVYHLIHGLLETVLVVGLSIRFFCHVTSFVIYYEGKHKRRCEIGRDDLHFNNIVKPVLDPEDGMQEFQMRAHPALWGLVMLLIAANTYTTETIATADAHYRFGFISPEMIYYSRLFVATHLCLDPVLGIADRIAHADLRAWSGW